MKLFKDQNAKYFKRISRWVSVNSEIVNSCRNSLFEYATDENGYRPHEDGFNCEFPLCCDYFRFNGEKLAVNRFYSLGSMWVNDPHYLTSKDGEKINLSGVDMYGNLFDPLYIELSPDCEKARFYRQVPNVFYHH